MPQLRSTLNSWTLIRRLLVFTCIFTIAFSLSSCSRAVQVAQMGKALHEPTTLNKEAPTSAPGAELDARSEKYSELLDEAAPYFGNPGQRRAVWSPKELSPEALRRIGFDLSFEPLTSDDQVPGLFGNFDLEVVNEQPEVVQPNISIEFWPKRIPEWSEGAVIPYPTPNDPDLAVSNLVALSDPDIDCWLLLDTRYGAMGVLISKNYVSKLTIDHTCELAAGAMKRYLEEFSRWLEEHPEFDPPLDAYGPRD